MKSYQQFFAELKRRHVFKVAAVYGVVAFGLIQVADPLAGALNLPDTFLTYVVAILLLGFPLALVLAWAFEVTPDGVRATEVASPGELESIVAAPASQRWPAGLMALVGVAFLIAGAWWVGRQTAPDAGGLATDPAAASDETAATDPETGLRFAYVDLANDPRPSIAVLPFADMSREGDQEYFSDGITEEILNTLAKIRDLRVSARTSAFAYKGVQRDLREVGRELSVAYLLEGSVRKDGDQLRITAQLIDVASDAHLWTDQYDRTLDNVFAIQTEIATAIAKALRVPLGLQDPEALVTPTADLEAYDIYLAGRARMRERGEGVHDAVELFDAAVARDSNWVPAWAGLAESTALLPWYADYAEPPLSPDSAYWARNLDAAEFAANRALELDRDNSSATVALANVLRDRWDWEAAEAAYERALALDPDNVEAHQQYAELLDNLGREDEALRAALRALSLDRSPIRLDVASWISAYNARYDEAIALGLEAIELDSENRLNWIRTDLADAYFAGGRWEEGRQTLLETAEIFAPEHLESVRQALPSALPSEMNPDLLYPLPGGPGTSALLWMLLGEHEKALLVLERVARERPPFGMTSVLWAPAFDPLRDDPRFESVLERRGMPGRRPIRDLPAASVSPADSSLD
ncbi:MAG: tetratricopeptide repeat protein [Gemmatimonadota bacterium]